LLLLLLPLHLLLLLLPLLLPLARLLLLLLLILLLHLLLLLLLLQYDVVPRACVSSLAALRSEIEEHKEQVFTNNQLAAYLRDSGAMSRGKELVGQFFKLAASAQVGL
jgi:hypothetical protein